MFHVVGTDGVLGIRYTLHLVPERGWHFPWDVRGEQHLADRH